MSYVNSITVRIDSSSIDCVTQFNGQGVEYDARVKAIGATGTTNEDVVVDVSFLHKQRFQLGTGNNYRGLLFPVKQAVGAVGSEPQPAQYQVLDMPWERCVISNTETVRCTLVDLSSTVTAGTKVYITLEYKLAGAD